MSLRMQFIALAPRWFTAFLALLITGCTGASLNSASAPPLQASASSTGEYLIGPGDTLEIFVWRQPDLSVTVPVRPDGRISTPLVEDLVAVNKTPTQLAREIERALSEYIRSPEVNVIVQGFVGVLGEQIRVLGQVKQPGHIAYRDKMTLLDVVLQAGGLTQYAAGNRSRLVRTVNGKSREMRIRLDDLVNRGRLEDNMFVQPGDILIVPEAVF